MTQQVETTAVPIHTDGAAPAAAVPMPRPAPPRGPAAVPPAGLGQGPGGISPERPGRRSAGRVVGIVAGVVGAGAVLLVCLVLVLSSLFAAASPASQAPAVPSVSAPTGAPAVPAAPSTPGGSVVPAGSPAGVRLLLAPAGKRLEAARATLGRDLTAAAGRRDLADFRAAFGRFDRELESYRTFVASLPVPPGREAAFTGLTSSIGAALADGRALEGVTSRRGLSAPAGRFDGHWSALVDAHNQLLHALAGP